MTDHVKHNHSCRAFRLGVVDYEETFLLQNRLAEARKEEKIGDVLLLLQHPPVITMGKSGKIQNVLSPDALRERKIKVIFTDRGGDVTYHGPGQLVIYPILSLRNYGLSVPGYVWNLEETAIRLLSNLGISSGRVQGLRGVWVGNEKIAALGVHLSRWVSKHGLALNVNTDLDPFSLINPCGTGRRATSISKILNRELPMEDIEGQMLNCFREVFGVTLAESPTRELEPYR